MQGSGSGWKGRVRKSWQTLSGMFRAKVNTAACQEGILMSPCAFSSLFLSNRAVCRGGSRRCECARCLGRKDAITPRGAGSALVPRGWSGSCAREQPRPCPGVPGRAGDLLLHGLHSCNEQRATGSHAAAWKQIPALTFKFFQVLFFFSSPLIFYPLICFLIKLLRLKRWLGLCVFHPWYRCICPGRIAELVWALWMPHKTSLNKSRSCGVKL